LWRSNSDDDPQARMNDTRKKIQTRRRRKLLEKIKPKDKTQECGVEKK
jgi:hypothetical protein